MKFTKEHMTATAAVTTFILTVYSIVTHDPYAISIMTLLSLLLIYDIVNDMTSNSKKIKAANELLIVIDSQIKPELSSIKESFTELQIQVRENVKSLNTEITEATKEVTVVKGEVANLQMANGFKKLK